MTTCITDRAALLASIDHNAQPIHRLLEAERLSELVVNPAGDVWYARDTQGYERAALRFPLGHLQNLCRYLATWADRALTAEQPAISVGPLPLRGHHYRATVIAPPLAPSLALCLRRIPAAPPVLEDYVTTKRLGATQASTLIHLLRHGEAVLVVGPQRSGKTTFAAALLNAVLRADPGLRTTLIEDTPEIRVEPDRNVLPLRTTAEHGLEALVALALRTGSDLICVGEIRDQSVIHLLNAFMSGHGGLSTFHASGPEEALYRIALLAGYRSTKAVAAAIPHVVTLRDTHVTEIALTRDAPRSAAAS